MPPTKARLLTDPLQNRLIVVAPIPGQLESIDTFINQVDKGVKSTGSRLWSAGSVPKPSRSPRVRPRTAEPATVAKILTEALTRPTAFGQHRHDRQCQRRTRQSECCRQRLPGDVQVAFDILSSSKTARAFRGAANPLL